MVKHSDGSQTQMKINLLKKVLNILTSVLHTDHEASLLLFTFIYSSLKYKTNLSKAETISLSSLCVETYLNFSQK